MEPKDLTPRFEVGDKERKANCGGKRTWMFRVQPSSALMAPYVPLIVVLPAEAAGSANCGVTQG